MTISVMMVLNVIVRFALNGKTTAMNLSKQKMTKSHENVIFAVLNM